MTEIEYFRRRLAELIVAGNRLQIDLPGSESWQMSDALHNLVHADTLVEAIERGRRDKTYGGGS